MQKLISIAQACDRWSIGRTRVFEFIKLGAFRAVKVGSRTLIDVQSGDNFFGTLPSIHETEVNKRQLGKGARPQ